MRKWERIRCENEVGRKKTCRTCLQISVRSSVPNALVKSSFFATCPLDTLTKTELVCKTSSRSFSLEENTSSLDSDMFVLGSFPKKLREEFN